MIGYYTGPEENKPFWGSLFWGKTSYEYLLDSQLYKEGSSSPIFIVKTRPVKFTGSDPSQGELEERLTFELKKITDRGIKVGGDEGLVIHSGHIKIELRRSDD